MAYGKAVARIEAERDDEPCASFEAASKLVPDFCAFCGWSDASHRKVEQPKLVPEIPLSFLTVSVTASSPDQ